jgi:hypothetical protein
MENLRIGASVGKPRSISRSIGRCLLEDTGWNGSQEEEEVHRDGSYVVVVMNCSRIWIAGVQRQQSTVVGVWDFGSGTLENNECFGKALVVQEWIAIYTTSQMEFVW